MSISQTKYIEIVSGVGGETEVSRRDLMARLITTSDSQEEGTVTEYDLAGVLSAFGSDSEEYAFAAKYFAYVSKSVTQASLISVANWVQDASASITSTIDLPDLADFQALTSDSLDIMVDGELCGTSAFDLSAVASYSDIATTINAEWVDEGTVPVLSYDETNAAFIITSPTTGDSSAIVAPASGGFATLAGLTSASSPTVVQGSDSAETPAEAMTRIDNLSDNFGSFRFMETLTNAEIASVAAWNAAMNYKYMYAVDVTSTNASDLATEVDGISGTHLTLDAGEYSTFMPMVLFATTDYDKVNSAKNFMFQKFDDETPTVTTDAEYTTYNALKVNYLGQTQSAGVGISFYQRGYNMDGVDAGPYCNEVWLKDAIGTELFALMLAVEMIPANATGESLGMNAIQTIIDTALFNATISKDKDLTSTQKAYITQVTGDDDAYIAVGSQGYWFDVSIDPETEDDVTKYILSYTLVYAKADAVRKVEGTNILI